MSLTRSNQALALRVGREMPATAEDIFDALVHPEKQRGVAGDAMLLARTRIAQAAMPSASRIV